MPKVTVEGRGAVDVPNGGIAYEQVGSGEALVFLHGATLNGTMWAEQVSALSRRFRCITVDRRGHGGSAPICDGYDPVLDLLGVLDEAGIGRCHLIGHSLGGFDAIWFAGRFADRVSSICLVGAWAQIPEMTWVPPVHVAREQGAEAGRRAWLGDPLFAPLARHPEVLSRVKAMVEANDLALWTRRVRSPDPAPPTVAELAPQVVAPTLVVVGELDLGPFHTTAQWYQATVAGAAAQPVVVMAGASHMAPLEDSAAFNRLLLGWLEE